MAEIASHRIPTQIATAPNVFFPAIRAFVHQIAAVTLPPTAWSYSDFATALLALTCPVSSSSRNAERKVFGSIPFPVRGEITTPAQGPPSPRRGRPHPVDRLFHTA